MFLSTGAFVRGTFADGLLTGNSYLRPNNEFAMLLRLVDGVLDAKTTVFDFSRDGLRVLNFREGQFLGIAKDFERSADKCHKEILQQLYGQEAGIVKHYLDLTNRIKTMPGNFFGTFALSEKVWFYGGFSNGAPNGLGVLVEMNSKVQIGFFENGQLAGFGRIMWPNGVVMDGMIKKATINEEVIIYNQVAHEWTKALFKDNSLFEELEKGMGYPRELHAGLFKDYFNRAYSKKVKVAISPEVFTQETPQEHLFRVVYGEEWDDSLPNYLGFALSGENNIEFDSRKDIAAIKESSIPVDRFSSPESSQKPARDNGFHQSGLLSSDVQSKVSRHESGVRSQASNYGDPRLKEKPAATQPQDDFRKFGGVHEDKTHFGMDREIRTGHSVSGEYDGDQTSSPETEKHMRMDDDRHARVNKMFDLEMEAFGDARNQQGGPQFSATHEGGKPKYPTPVFDRFDLLILQRAVTWEGDKTLNSKNKYTRKTLSNKTISEDTKLNIVRNYVEDFMEAFLDKKEIDRLMGGIEAYQLLKQKQ